MRARTFPSIACAALVCAALVLGAAIAAAPVRADIVIVNLDGAGEGFNDATPVAPVGGNPGVTVGQQRLNLFQHCADIWHALLGSSVQIRIEANFDPLFCTATSAVLGGAGPNPVDSDFAGAGYAATWYAGAEANRLAGVDLDPFDNDIGCVFNSNIGMAGCLTGRSWYYGYDGNEGASGVDLLPVLLHEFGHGLGFLTLTDESTGDYFSRQPTIFDRFLMDDQTGKHWNEMTPAERVTSALNTGHLVWDGPAVTHSTGVWLGPRARVDASGQITGTFIGSQGNFGAPLTTGGLAAQVVIVNDGVGTASDACETPFVNAGAVSGKIALIDRGTCTTIAKAINAQANGAAGILFVNNAGSTPGTWSGVAPSVTIPIIGVSQTDGNAIRTAIGAGVVTLTIGLDPAHAAGANDNGLAWMYAPNPVQPGSSVSHFDVTMFPNKLMEPSLNADLEDDVDLTYELFIDIGWFPQIVSVGDADHKFGISLGPNPSRDGGTLRFGLAAASDVDISIFDVAGRRITRLAHSRMSAGPQEIRWGRLDDAGRRLPAGVYLARFRAGAIERAVHFVLVD